MGRKNRNQGGKGGGQRGGQRPGQQNRPAAAAQLAEPQQAQARPQAAAASTGFTGSRPAPVQRVASTTAQAAPASAPKHNVIPFGSLSSADKNLLIVFTGTTLVSALLLFSVQPMFAKMVLPVLGGSPSVWAVAMCFFQGMLLLGYLYAHFLINMVDRKISGFVHIAVCAVAFLFLPIAMPASWNNPPTGEPYLWQLAVFAVGVGLPFFAVAANAPLLQAWFSQTEHPHRSDPYFLYGASNLGSMVALLAYPFVFEPLFGLTQLSRVWTFGFVALVLLLGTCFWYVRSVPDKAVASATSSSAADTPAPSLADRARWVGLALVPSALLTAFTTHVTTDVASAPLLWVIPLALYLLTFVFVFRDKPMIMVPVGLIVACLAYAVLSILNQRGGGGSGEFAGLLALVAGGIFMFLHYQGKIGDRDGLLWTHLATVIAAMYFVSHLRGGGWFTSAAVGCAAFVASAMVAHRTLYETRPGTKHLTEFYLWLSLGGVLGGLFAGLIAPKIFKEIYEYPLLIALTMACRPGALNFNWREKTDELFVLILIAAIGLLGVMWLPWLVDRSPELARLQISPFYWWPKPTALVLMFAAVMLYFWRMPVRQLVLAMLMFAATVAMQSGVRQDGVASRSFFGVYRVSQGGAHGEYNVLVHGTTLHGAQRMRDDQGNLLNPPDLTPTTYYHPASPMGQSVNIVRERLEKEGNKKGNYAVIGLGSGSMGCHKKGEENWTYFEIDPVMRGITTNPVNFSFVTNCLGTSPNIVMGDARLTMAKQPDGKFDLIVVDAFSSDAVPVHLMTKEALELFKSKLTPKGVAVLHVSNRYLDLDGVLAATQPLVPDFHGLIVTDEHSEGYAASASTAVMFSKDPKSLDGFRQIPKRIQTTETRELVDEHRRKQLRPWTDDYSDIVGPFMVRNFPTRQ